MAIDKGLMSGSTGLMVLHLLSLEDMYGYQLVRELACRSDETFCLKEGTLYPLLHTMERENWIEAYHGMGDNGRSRKYYRVTDAGRLQLQAQTAQWQTFSHSVNKVLGGVQYGH